MYPYGGPPNPGYMPQSGAPYPPQPTYPPQGQGAYYPPQPQMPYPTGDPNAGYGQAQPNYGYPGAMPQFPGMPQGFPGMPQQQFPGMPQQQFPGMPQGQQQYAPQFAHTEYQVQAQPCYGQPAGSGIKKGTPTVPPVPNFDAGRDAQILRKAMKGFGTDENAIISVLCHRPSFQRQEIVKAFKQSYGKELVDDIKSETRANFEKILVALLTPLHEFYAKELRTAIEGIGTDEDVLIEVLCCLTNQEIINIKNCYHFLYGTTLEQDLMSETSGNFKRFLRSLCNAGRDETGFVDINAARADAQDLINAGIGRMGTDESTFNRVLCQRNFEHLKLVCGEYEKLTGHTLEKAVKREFSGDIEDGLVAILRCVNDKFEYFAKKLHESMAGLGTNDDQLIRLVVTRCEVDMVDIKEAFQRKYGKSLKSFVKGDLSGDYKHAVYALIGETK